MKKLSVIFFCAVILFTLAACVHTSAENVPPEPEYIMMR